ncbi:MAG: 30S ribosomal protein S2 [Candidatus Bathyarchaeota archaeon]|nr:MAG: 30S ribosomal protein S2 [Candidatus Bathyarchaeota archaeon]
MISERKEGWLKFHYRRIKILTKKEESEQIENTEEEEPRSSEASASSEEVAIPSEEDLLLPRDVLLSAGLHIGTRMKTKDMDEFIYRVRPDGLFVLDVKKTDERIRAAAKFLSRFEPDRIAAVASRLYARYPAQKFCETTKATPIAGRFVPGLFSNPLYANHIEPAVIIVSDPKADVQAVKEAGVMGIPVIALCSTDNDFAGVDLVIPTNNKGRRALAVIYWMLARQLLRERGELTPDKDIDLSVEDFEARVPQG